MAVMLLVVWSFTTSPPSTEPGAGRRPPPTPPEGAGLELTPYFGVGSDPHGAAREYAARNGAELLECTCGAGGRYVWVTVRVSMGAHLLLVGGRRAKVTATARCYLDPAPGATESSTTSTLSI